MRSYEVLLVSDHIMRYYEILLDIMRFYEVVGRRGGVGGGGSGGGLKVGRVVLGDGEGRKGGTV